MGQPVGAVQPCCCLLAPWAAVLLSLCAPAAPLPAAGTLRAKRYRCPPHPNRPARPNRPQDEYGSPHLHQLIISLPCPHPHQARKIRQALVKMGFHPPGSEGAAAAAAAAAAPAPAPATEHKPAAAATAAPAAAPAPVAAAAVAPPPAGYPPPAVAAAPAPYPPPPGGAPMPYGAPPAPVPYGAAPPAYAYPRECHPSLATWQPGRRDALQQFTRHRGRSLRVSCSLMHCCTGCCMGGSLLSGSLPVDLCCPACAVCHWALPQPTSRASHAPLLPPPQRRSRPHRRRTTPEKRWRQPCCSPLRAGELGRVRFCTRFDELGGVQCALVSVSWEGPGVRSPRVCLLASALRAHVALARCLPCPVLPCCRDACTKPASPRMPKPAC